MKVVRLAISTFRSIKSVELLFDGLTLCVGTNNVGKNTICDALDLVLCLIDSPAPPSTRSISIIRSIWPLRRRKAPALNPSRCTSESS